MLTIYGAKQSFCDRISRRDFLSVGSLAVAGLSLPDLLRLRAEGAAPTNKSRSSSHKAVINVVLPGGPSHIDSYDPKPSAPSEIRGEFGTIATNVPGLQICELMPRQAQMADKLTILRNMGLDDGDAHQLHVPLTGFYSRQERPAFGSIVSRVRSDHASPLPQYVSMVGDIHPDNRGHEEPRYAGAAHRPFSPGGLGREVCSCLRCRAARGGPDLENLGLARGMTLDRLADRRTLLGSFDGLRRQVDAEVELAAVDGFTTQALDIVSSGRARDAFDLSREPPAVHQRYGGNVVLKKQAMYTHTWQGSKFLLARRLVEAGVPVVSLSVGFWDTHEANFVYLREQLPLLDRSLSALVGDLHERGLADDVAVVVWGEFYGRSPRINKKAGRDHWKRTGSAVVAGGGLRTGQVVGATDAQGYDVVGPRYSPQNVLATLYGVLGINPSQTLTDHNGRPQYLLDDREGIAELL